MKKKRDLTIVIGIYFLAFVLGYMSCIRFDDIMLKLFIFDVVATVITFIFSVILHNSSVYDPYWSATPMVMVAWLFIVEKSWGIWQILFILIFELWGFRLTKNWVEMFTDFTYEDWRYIKYRNETPRIFWPVVNFFGIHMMPTLIVFAGMMPIFEIAKHPLGWKSMPGMLVMLFGIALEFFSDRQMHAFLGSDNHGAVCDAGLWKYSRHPNYLGEISLWIGVYMVMLPYAPERWYYGAGCMAVVLLFNVVSVPLMEKRQLARRPQYEEYKEITSRLVLRPRKQQ